MRWEEGSGKPRQRGWWNKGIIDLGYSLEADDTMAVRLHCSNMSRVKRRRKKKKGKTKTVDRVVIVRLGSGSGGSPLSMQRSGQLGMQNARFGQRGHFAVVLDAPLRESVRQSHDNRGQASTCAVRDT